MAKYTQKEFLNECSMLGGLDRAFDYGITPHDINRQDTEFAVLVYEAWDSYKNFKKLERVLNLIADYEE